MSTQRARISLVGLGPIGIEVGKALARPGGRRARRRRRPGSGQGRPAALGASRRGLPGRHDFGPSAAALYAQTAGSRAPRRRRRALHRLAPPRDAAADRGGDRGRAPHRLDLRGAVVSGAAPRAHGAPDRPAGEGEGRRRPRHRSQPGSRHGPAGSRRGRRPACASTRCGSPGSSTPPSAAGPLRAKVGAGLSREEFVAGVASKKLGHVGLSESAAIIALGLGLPIDEITETIKPVIAERETDGVAAGPRARTPPGRARPGRRRGQGRARPDDGRGRARSRGPDRHRGRPRPAPDRAGGFHGDRSTIGTVVNAIPFIVAAPAGLHNVVTLPLFGLQPLP